MGDGEIGSEGSVTQGVQTQRTPEYYERLLDPDKTLPRVVIEQQPVRTKGTLIPTDFKIFNEQGAEIGSLRVNISRPPSGREAQAYLNTITIHEGLRRQKYGRSTYLELLKHLGDVKLNSGFQLSRGSRPIWDWMVEKGVARKLTDHGVDEARENAGYSADEYEVI